MFTLSVQEIYAWQTSNINAPMLMLFSDKHVNTGIVKNALSSDTCLTLGALLNYALNTEFVAAKGLLRKKLNHHSRAETFSIIAIVQVIRF